MVADEVRTLASGTQESTRQIQAQIEKLQTGTQRAMAAMQASQKQAGSSVCQALQEITGSVTSISEWVESIAESIRRQERVAGEVDQSIGRINEAAQNSAHSMQEMTVASDELARLAGVLQGMTGRFRV